MLKVEKFSLFVEKFSWKVQFICWKVEHFQLVEKFSFIKFVRILPYEKYKFPKSSGSVFQLTQLFSGSVFSICSTFQLLFVERKWLKTHLSQGFDSLFEEELSWCFCGASVVFHIHSIFFTMLIAISVSYYYWFIYFRGSVIYIWGDFWFFICNACCYWFFSCFCSAFSGDFCSYCYYRFFL